MKILILGSTGFIGKNLLQRLKKDKYKVVTAERSSGTDLRDYFQVEALLKKENPDVIFNLASHGGSVHYVRSNAADIYFDNVQMCLNIYKAILKINTNIKLIQPFSNCSYPGNSSLQKEEEWLTGDVHPSVFSFGNSKRAIFYASRCFYEQYGINTVNILFPNTYGPGDSLDPAHTHALNGMIIRMLEAKKNKNNEFIVWGTGSPIREWAYIDDFVDVLVRCMSFKKLLYPVNMGQGRGFSIAESAQMIKDACGFEGEIVFDTKYTDGDPVKVLSNERFQKLFDNFEFFDHFEGLQETIKYYEKLL